MAKKQKSIAARNQSYAANSRIAENNVAASTDENHRQKGDIPNSPSTG